MLPKIVTEVFDQIEVEFTTSNGSFIWSSDVDRRCIYDAVRRQMNHAGFGQWAGEAKGKNKTHRDPGATLNSAESETVQKLLIYVFYELLRFTPPRHSGLLRYPDTLSSVLFRVLTRLAQRGAIVSTAACSSDIKAA